MNKVIKSLIGGLAGATALNIVHQLVKKVDHDAPRVDLIGEEGLRDVMKAAGLKPPTGDKLFVSAMVGDIISNTLYYSVLGLGTKKFLTLRGAGHGFAAGLGAIVFTKKLGLSDAPVTRTSKTKLMTVAWYTIGGIVTASTIKMLNKKHL